MKRVIIQYHLIPVSMQFPQIGKHAAPELKCSFASGLVMTCIFSFDPSGAGVWHWWADLHATHLIKWYSCKCPPLKRRVPALPDWSLLSRFQRLWYLAMIWLWICGSGNLVFKAEKLTRDIKAVDENNLCFWHYNHHLPTSQGILRRTPLEFLPFSPQESPVGRVSLLPTGDTWGHHHSEKWNHLATLTAQKQQSLALELLIPVLFTLVRPSCWLSEDIIIGTVRLLKELPEFPLYCCLSLQVERSFAELLRRSVATLKFLQT